MGEYFSNEEECQHFTDNSTSFGLSILMSYFVENIRQAKNRAIKNPVGVKTNRYFLIFIKLVTVVAHAKDLKQEQEDVNEV